MGDITGGDDLGAGGTTFIDSEDLPVPTPAEAQSVLSVLAQAAAPETVVCPQCGAEAWDEVKARSGAVTQCPGCWYRVAYGVAMPRVAVAPDGPLVKLSLSHLGHPMVYEYSLDPGLALLLAMNLASMLSEGMRVSLAQKILATVHA